MTVAIFHHQIALEEANLSGKEIVYDLFCGTGSISLFISKHAKMVYGFELAMSAVQDAMQNDTHNGSSTSFIFTDISLFVFLCSVVWRIRYLSFFSDGFYDLYDPLFDKL